MNSAIGELHDDYVIVPDQSDASQLHNKGYFGNPQSGGALKLDLIEAVYLSDAGRLTVRKGKRKMGMERLLRHADNKINGFEIKYLVYRDLRLRGFALKGGARPLDFRVYPRGGAPGKTPSKYWVSAISERAVFDLPKLIRHLMKAIDLRKQLLLGVVDEESDLTYYKVRWVKPKGKLKQKKCGYIGEAVFLGDRVMVMDETVAVMLSTAGFYGKMIGSRLQLSLIETAYLYEMGMINVRNAETGRKISFETFMKKAERIQPDFGLRLKVYKALKAKGLIVKTGFKYGAHFRAYEADPDSCHAKYLVHAVPKNFRSMWPEISRAVRLAHGVKKELLIARNIDEETNEYLMLKRYRP